MKAAVIGSFVVDLVGRTPHLPEAGETVKGSSFQMGAGGKGFNQAIAAHRAGCDMIFSTKLGNDDFSKLALKTLADENISDQYVFKTDECSTGVALITVDENTSQNEIVVVPSACETFGSVELTTLAEAMDDCDYLLLQLEINVDAVEKLIATATEKNIMVILNPAPVQPLSDNILEKLYMITPNEVEAKILTGVTCDTEASCKKAADIFFKKGIKNVVITLGARGCYASDGKNERFCPNYHVSVVDTTGAGDAFNGGMLAGLAQGMGFFDAVDFANIISNISVTRRGTSCSMPTMKEIAEFKATTGNYSAM